VKRAAGSAWLGVVDPIAAVLRPWLLGTLGFAIVVYLAGVLLLAVLGRRSDARALAGFIPDCIVLLQRLIRDRRVPRRHKVLLVGCIAYLAMPIDLVPDVIPVAGQLDDAIIVALALRSVLRGGGRALLEEHWPGPQSSLRIVGRLVGG
jgi:uncharacterized membrane protein YkvA (DUF1232 family)